MVGHTKFDHLSMELIFADVITKFFIILWIDTVFNNVRRILKKSELYMEAMQCMK